MSAASTPSKLNIALIPSLIERYSLAHPTKNETRAVEILAIVAGTLYLALLAQVAIPLPFTPVPITGQTFGIATLALLYGRNRAFATFALYLVEGAIGLPVFAQAAHGLHLGPTLGYLIGMGVSTIVIGALADRGVTRTYRGAFLACVLGSVCVFGGGLAVLSSFLPADRLIVAGLLPFLPGDLVKNALAAALAVRAARNA